MKNDSISREALINVKPEFMNEKVVRNTKYRTTKDRIYAKAWNACNSYWLNTIDNAPTVEYPFYREAYQTGYEEGKNERPQGEKIKKKPYGWVYCSECDSLLEPQDKFCWNCGADIRGEKK